MENKKKITMINSITIDSSYSRTDLCDLGVKYPTDKSPYNTENQVTPNGSSHRHPYTSVYDFIFSNLRYSKIKFAEIGVLDNMSMRCWREYFDKAELFGFDYNPYFLEEGKNLGLNDTTYDFINIKSSESIIDSLNKYGKFDVIIEDSTHEFDDQVRLIKLAHKFLNPGGILVIEDVFRHINENDFLSEITDISEYYSNITFVMTEHKFKFSPGWDNDKLLIFFRNDR